MIFEALQSELVRFDFHFLRSKLQKIPELNLSMTTYETLLTVLWWTEWKYDSKPKGKLPVQPGVKGTDRSWQFIPVTPEDGNFMFRRDENRTRTRKILELRVEGETKRKLGRGPNKDEIRTTRDRDLEIFEPITGPVQAVVEILRQGWSKMAVLRSPA